MNKREVGARIKAYMKENRLTQTEVAAKVGISQSYISGMVNGDKDTLRLAEALSENYGVSLDWLINGDNALAFIQKGDNITDRSNNITNEKMRYLERAMELFQKYMDNERRYQEIIKENQEIMKQMAAIQQLIKEG